MLQSPFLSKGDSIPIDERKFHYAFFLPAEDHFFFSKVRDGAIDAASSLDCAITFHPIDSDPLSFEMAHFSGFDGFGLYLYEEEEDKLQYLSMILQNNIPVVQIENEVIQGAESFFIGTNNFDVGKGIGQLIQTIESDNINVALVYSKKNPGVLSDRNLVEMGLKSVLGDRLSELKTEETSLNPLDAGIFAYNLLKIQPSIDIIVLTDPNDTLVTVQTIIDMNLVGMVQIIGFGENETIKAYIEKDVILGSIVRNPYMIGYSTVVALKELSTTGYTSVYVDTGITILEKKNHE